MQILFRDKKQLFTEVEVASSGKAFCSQPTRVWRRSLGGTGGESVNSAGYSLIEQPIRAREKHYPLF